MSSKDLSSFKSTLNRGWYRLTKAASKINASTSLFVSMNNGRNRKDNILAATGDVSDKSFSKSFVGINKF